MDPILIAQAVMQLGISVQNLLSHLSHAKEVSPHINDVMPHANAVVQAHATLAALMPQPKANPSEEGGNTTGSSPSPDAAPAEPA